MSKPTLTVTEDNTDKFKELVDRFRNDSVLVGIPADDTNRSDDSPIGNAALLFINEFGSPLNNIPPRPAMKIGIGLAQDAIADEFKKAVQQTLKNGMPALTRYYERVGMIASNSVKKVINDQTDIEPPAESTLKSRKSKGFKGTKALIVTGQMRNAITYVVTGK